MNRNRSDLVAKAVRRPLPINLAGCTVFRNYLINGRCTCTAVSVRLGIYKSGHLSERVGHRAPVVGFLLVAFIK